MKGNVFWLPKIVCKGKKKTIKRMVYFHLFFTAKGKVLKAMFFGYPKLFVRVKKTIKGWYFPLLFASKGKVLMITMGNPQVT